DAKAGAGREAEERLIEGGSLMIPCLPQDDVEPMERVSELARARDEYRYDHDRLPPVAMTAEVPSRDSPPAGRKVAIAEALVQLTFNGALATGNDDDQPSTKPTSSGIAQAHHALDFLKNLAFRSRARGRAEDIKDFYELFRDIQLPGFAKTFMSA